MNPCLGKTLTASVAPRNWWRSSLRFISLSNQQKHKRIRQRHRRANQRSSNTYRNRTIASIDRFLRSKGSRFLIAAVVALISAQLIHPHLILVLVPVAACLTLLSSRNSETKKRGDVGDPPVSSLLGPNLDASLQSRHINFKEEIRSKSRGQNDEQQKK